MLWLDITEDGIVLCCRARRLTPTLNSPFSPLYLYIQHKVLESLEVKLLNLIINRNNHLSQLTNNTSWKQMHHQQPVSLMLQTYSTRWWADASGDDLVRCDNCKTTAKLLSNLNQRDEPTSEYVFESPFESMEILGGQLLSRRLLWHILTRKENQNYKHRNLTAEKTRVQPQNHIAKSTKLTSGGRQSLACLRRTEKPPWVLVSEAVNILQNERTAGLGASCWIGSGLLSSFCYQNSIQNTIWNFKTQSWISFMKNKMFILKRKTKSLHQVPASK